MKVFELKLLLDKLDGDSDILLQGYEGGLTEIISIDHVPLILRDYNQHWWVGEHEECDDMRDVEEKELFENKNFQLMGAYVIRRKR